MQFFWQGKAQNSSPILRCTFLARRSAKLIANFRATMVTSLPSFSLSLSLSLYLSLSHRMYLTHNIGSASALPIITRECKHCGASLGRHPPFSSMETKSRPIEEMSSISGYLPSNARRRSEGKARPREDEMAVPPRALLNSFISTLRIRFLVLVVFSVRSSIFFEHCRKNSVNQRPLKSKAEVWTPIVDLLCVKDG